MRGSEFELRKGKEVNNVTGHAAQNGNQTQGGEGVFTSQLGVSQEEVQKKPQLGTTQ
jgi:hypothetical protein